MKNLNLKVNHKVWGPCTLTETEYRSVSLDNTKFDYIGQLQLSDGSIKKVSLTTCIKDNIIDMSELSDEVMNEFTEATVSIATADETARADMMRRAEQHAKEFRAQLKKQRQRQATAIRLSQEDEEDFMEDI